jgi:hypothetical protein
MGPGIARKGFERGDAALGDAWVCLIHARLVFSEVR